MAKKIEEKKTYPRDTNVFVLVGYNNDKISGTADEWMRTCMVYTGRTTQVNYAKDDDTTARAMAKYMGMTLGMKFAQKGRRDSKGKVCPDNGIMGKANGPKVWSNCAKEDFLYYYNRYQPFCMKTMK